MTTTATMGNMRALYAPDVFAYSPYTGEQYSANPSDYFWADDAWTMTDSEGEPMVLVRRSVHFEDVTP